MGLLMYVRAHGWRDDPLIRIHNNNNKKKMGFLMYLRAYGWREEALINNNKIITTQKIINLKIGALDVYKGSRMARRVINR
jgi:hypothetical protein